MVVYCVTNTINKKVYVGKTERTLGVRWQQHLHDAAKQSNRCPLLYRAMNKHGVENFSIQEVAVAISRQELDDLERLWIAKLHSAEAGFGYNLTLGGTGGKLNPVALAKMAATQRRRFASPEERAKCAFWTGLKRPKETRLKMSASQTGRKHSSKTRAQMSAYHKQLGSAAMAHLYTPELNASRSRKMSGRIVSQVTKDKLRQAALRRYAAAH